MQLCSKWIVIAAITLSQGASLVWAADAKRQHDAHVHGKGMLNLVQEGKQLHVELDIPGMDLVGFEHQAHTAAQKKSVQDAVATLKKGDTIFQINAEAKCTINSAKVDVALMDDDHDTDHKDAHDKKPGHKESEHHDHAHKTEAAHRSHHHESKGEKHDDHRESQEERHSEFHAHYVFTCTAPEHLQQLRVGLFEAFTGSESLQAQLITDHQQRSQRLTPTAPVIKFRP